MLLFRVFYVAMIPAGVYYFYWLLVRGGNELAPVCFGVFLLSEVLSFVSALISLFGMWKPVRRKWRSLDQLRPGLPDTEWPTVDICISHYKEDVEALRQTVRAAMRLDYPAHLLHIIIGDDGYYPKSKVVERSDLGVDMYTMCAEEAGYDPLMEEEMNSKGALAAMGGGARAAGGRRAVAACLADGRRGGGGGGGVGSGCGRRG